MVTALKVTGGPRRRSQVRVARCAVAGGDGASVQRPHCEAAPGPLGPPRVEVPLETKSMRAIGPVSALWK
jgi:hypothetical protein